MSTQLQALSQMASTQPSVSTQHGFLQRKCACGQHTIAGNECAECRQRSQEILQRAAVSSASVNTVPPIVHDVLDTPGQPLDAATRTFMEPRFGHDFSQVRVHTDEKAAESAQAINALAYTVGRDVVFGPGQYVPGMTEGKRLLAHELTHAVQQSSTSQDNRGIIQEGNDIYEKEAESAARKVAQTQTEQQEPFFSQPLPITRSVPTIARDTQHDASGNVIAFEFKVGTELSLQFVALAQKLTKSGITSDDNLRELRDQALKARETVDDHERMFMAGLLDPTNVKKLQATVIKPNASITFSLASITTARIQHVIDLDRKSLPPSVTGPAQKGITALKELDVVKGFKQLGEAEEASLKEIVTNAGSFKAQVNNLVTFVRSHTILPSDVLQAMKAAASDNSASDQVMAGTVYAIAKEAGNPLVSDLLSGKIKVDALTPGAFVKLKGLTGKEVAFYVSAAQKTGLKGDTIYVRTSLDIANQYDRSAVIHELRHAEDDKAASPTGKLSFPLKDRTELAAYRTQGLYILNQLLSQSGPEQLRSAEQVAKGKNGIVLGAILLEGQKDQVRYRPILEKIFDKASGKFHQDAAGVARILKVPSAKLEAAILADINQAYGLQPGETTVVEGLAGESLIHWINRI